MPDATPSVVVENVADVNVDDALDAQIRELLCACFPKDEQFRAHRYWQKPPLHRWFIRDNDQRLAAHTAVHRLVLGTDVGDLTVGGIAEVAVRAECRGRGLVRLMLNHVHPWLAGQDYAFAMLLGRTEVYTSSGYVNIDNPIRYTDFKTGQVKEERMSIAMIRPLTDQPWPSGVIDLRGPIF